MGASLPDPSTSQLLKFASSIDEGGVTDTVYELSGPELYDLLVDYIRRKKLEALEDGGMSQFLLLNHMLSDLLALDAGEVGACQTELRKILPILVRGTQGGKFSGEAKQRHWGLQPQEIYEPWILVGKKVEK